MRRRAAGGAGTSPVARLLEAADSKLDGERRPAEKCLQSGLRRGTLGAAAGAGGRKTRLSLRPHVLPPAPVEHAGFFVGRPMADEKLRWWKLPGSVWIPLFAVTVAAVGFLYTHQAPKKSAGRGDPRARQERRESTAESGKPVVVGERVVTRDEFGEDWPLTIDRGVLQLRSSWMGGSWHPAWRVTLKSGDSVYGLNGHALSDGYQKTDPIRLPHPERGEYGHRLSLSPLIQAGLALAPQETR